VGGGEQEQAVAFMGMASAMVLRSLQPCGRSPGGHPTLSLRSLAEAEAAAWLLCQLAPAAGRWQLAAPQELPACRRVS
jgi:hypothetical protein